MSKVELLAPVGDWDCLKAAVQNGADAVYFGVEQFNARMYAKNFNIDDMKQVINYCKLRNVKTNLTLNTLIKNCEFENAIDLVKEAYVAGIDAIIVQDFGLAKYLIDNFPHLPIHASTQMTVHNLQGVLELEKLGFDRVVLSRELSCEEIEYICKNCNVEIETFIHGALCICYSGQCLFSSVVGGRSGNRGKCAGPCRLPYELISENNSTHEIKTINKGYLLSTKDLCGIAYIPRLIQAGVIATAGTIRSKGWENAIINAIDDANVQSIACPLLAPMVEEGWNDNKIAELAINEYLQPFNKIDLLILGCTHYPLLTKVIRKKIGNRVEIINIGEHVAKETKNILSDRNEVAQNKKQELDIYLTETECKFNEVASKLLGEEVKAKQVKEELEFLN